MVKFKSENLKDKVNMTFLSVRRDVFAGRGDGWTEVCVQNQPEKINNPTVEGFKSLHELQNGGVVHSFMRQRMIG